MGIRKFLLLCAPTIMLAACRPLSGGYTGQREPTDEEMEMFRSVTASNDVTYTPLSVSTQVVAGTNYRFYCRYEGNESGYCWITIFKPLPGQGEATLTSIEKILQFSGPNHFNRPGNSCRGFFPNVDHTFLS